MSLRYSRDGRMSYNARVPAHRNRSAAIIISDSSVALIRRRRGGRLYYVFPGGGVEEGEAPEHAAIREVYEETGLRISVSRLVAVVQRRGGRQYHYLADVAGGELGTGTGPEMTGMYPSDRGTYEAVWMPIDSLLDHPVHPRRIGELVVSARTCGWPESPVCYIDGE